MITILIVLLVLAMLGSLPSWPYSTGWGYYPSSGLGLILLILVVRRIVITLRKLLNGEWRSRVPA